jgi:tRNA threonylcarbamoyladenosine biosynthesis protein TsaE
MNSVMTFKRSTSSSEESNRLGKKLGQLLKGGEVIELRGDLGSGKTTITKGIVAGLGSDSDVVSPTFTVSRSYPAKNGLTVYHFDFYRMYGHDITGDELDEVAGRPDSVAIVEWAGNGKVSLPKKRLRIKLLLLKKEQSRAVEIESLDPGFDHIIKGLEP